MSLDPNTLEPIHASPGMVAKIDRLMALRQWADEADDIRDLRVIGWLDEFLADIKPVLDALHDLACCDRDMWHMNAGHFTCSEAEAITDLLRALGGDEDADVFMESHAEYDQPGDIHYREGSEDD